ncbi:TPA: hypothetical protein ACGIK9_003316 [Acinetobacter baumannii]|uniref:hypothetical protein n=1 Tax=Acinetobacter baumannii TaxID=470 RepID=UPI0033906DCD
MEYKTEAKSKHIKTVLLIVFFYIPMSVFCIWVLHSKMSQNFDAQKASELQTLIDNKCKQTEIIQPEQPFLPTAETRYRYTCKNGKAFTLITDYKQLAIADN